MSSKQYREAYYEASRALSTATDAIKDAVGNAVNTVHEFAKNHLTTTTLITHAVVAVVGVGVDKAISSTTAICNCITNCTCG